MKRKKGKVKKTPKGAFLAGKTAQKFFHLADALFLGGDDRLQDGFQFRADTVFQGGLGKGHSPFMVRNHFPQEVTVDGIA